MEFLTNAAIYNVIADWRSNSPGSDHELKVLVGREVEPQ